MNFKLLTIIFIFNLSYGLSQPMKAVKFNEVEQIIKSKNDTLYILNFWATWCQPCVKELPYFEEITEKYKDNKLRVLLISMDFADDVEKRLIPFLNKKTLKSTVWWLDELKQNDFIAKVEENWYGAIPFTLIKRGSSEERYWREGKWNQNQLNKKIEEIL